MEQLRRNVPVFEAEAGQGLSTRQAEERERAGWDNRPIEPPGKTVGQIIRSNILTYFNMLFFLLAVCVIVVGQWQEAMFLGVVFANIIIGIAQELRSKATLDKLTLLTEPKGTVVRDGRERTIETRLMVRDDIVVFSAGSQIFADAVVVSGECAVNEALITGEADEIKKTPGTELLSGSFVVSGVCRARLTRVGADSYANRLTTEAKESRPPKQSEMMRSLTRLVQVIGVVIIPLGVLMGVKEIAWLGRSVSDGVVATVASLVGMIPEGLYLLTSLALVAGVVRLAQKKTPGPRHGLHRDARARGRPLRGQDRHGDGEQDDRRGRRLPLPGQVHRERHTPHHGRLRRRDERGQRHHGRPAPLLHRRGKAAGREGPALHQREEVRRRQLPLRRDLSPGRAGRAAGRALRRVRRQDRRIQRQGLPRAAAGALRRFAGRRAPHGGADAPRAHTAREQDTRRGARHLQVLRRAGRDRQGHLRGQRRRRQRGGPSARA